MKKSIIVVDDDPTCNQFLTLLLEDEGYEVRAATCAADALRLAEESPPHVLIADWLLKDGIDGAEVARRLKKAQPDLRVVFTTGSPAEQLAEQVSTMSNVAILEKPIQIENLLVEIDPTFVS